MIIWRHEMTYNSPVVSYLSLCWKRFRFFTGNCLCQRMMILLRNYITLLLLAVQICQQGICNIALKQFDELWKLICRYFLKGILDKTGSKNKNCWYILFNVYKTKNVLLPKSYPIHKRTWLKSLCSLIILFLFWILN